MQYIRSALYLEKGVRGIVLRKEFIMKMDILKKAAALALSGAMLIASTHISPPSMISDAAVNNEEQADIRS